ncbi:hypothetical protein JIN07_003669 [Acinetobacter baumannii]|nr:hypothetical protein [Acinetobacter baumannii]EKY1330580.1 hypothetical protein [Acinetobacter baumannii]EKY1446890.1 hypothetical protein [Acinetobacter baumannii]
MDKPMTFIEWCSSNGKIPYSVGIEEAYEAGQQSMQAKVEELQRRNQMLNDNIKEQGQKLVYQNEVIETQAEKLLGLRDEKAELQKRVDALSKRLSEATGLVVEELEQALKGDQYDEHRKKAEEAISEK